MIRGKIADAIRAYEKRQRDYDYVFEIIDEASTGRAVALIDGRQGLGLVVHSLDGLAYLIRHGAKQYLKTAHSKTPKA